jgi:hypothetical protein
MRRRRGFSVLEVLLAGSLTLLILLAAEQAVQYLGQSAARMANKVEPRQQLRTLLLHLRNDLQAASYVFLGESRTWAGIPLSVPTAGNAGEQLIFAIPADDSANTRYTVCMIFPRMRTVSDPNNPNVREIVYRRYDPVQAPTPNLPSSILPATIGTSSDRTFDTYLPVGSPTSSDPPWSIRVAPNGRGFQIQAHFRIKPQRGAEIDERFDTFITLRNDV